MFFWHRNFPIRSRTFYSRRNIYIRSRFQPVFHSTEESINIPGINSATVSNLEPPVHIKNSNEQKSLAYLQDSIVYKINCLKLSKSADENSDFKLLRELESARPKLTDVDEFILRISKMMIESSTHSLDYMKTLQIKNKFVKDGKTFKFKYQLLSDEATIAELTTLKNFIYRLTKDNYVNNSEKIRSFLVHRIINCRDTNFLLQQDRELTYLLLHYFLRKYKPSNLDIIEKLIKNIDVHDTKLLNLMMKYSFKNVSSQTDKLILINKVLDAFIYHGISLNRTSIYLIFKHVTFRKNIPDMKLHHFLLKYMKDEEIIDNKYITSILYEKLLKMYILYNEPKNINLKPIINTEIKLLINMIPKFNEVDLHNVSLSGMRKLFSSSKFNDEISFKRIIQMHLLENKWKFVWDTISTHRLLQDNSLPNFSRNKLFQKFPSLKYSNFGSSFKNKFNFLGPLWASELCYYAIKTQNWELLIRVLNEFDDVKYLVFTKAFASLLELNVKNSRLHLNEYLVIVKFLLHKSLKNKMGPFIRNDLIFKKFQERIDSFYNTSFCAQNYTLWQQELEIAKCEIEKHDNPRFKLFDGIFTKNDQYISTVVLEEEENDKSSCELFGDLITPDLSRITLFEKTVFKKISDLKILDTEQKVSREYKNYSEFWDSKRINISDVKSNYFLGVADSSYTNASIEWEQVKPDLGDVFFSESIHSNDNNIGNQSSSFHDKDLIPLYNRNSEYRIILSTKNGTRPLDSKSSLNNVLPTDWLEFPIQQTYREWIEDSILKGTSKGGGIDKSLDS